MSKDFSIQYEMPLDAQKPGNTNFSSWLWVTTTLLHLLCNLAEELERIGLMQDLIHQHLNQSQAKSFLISCCRIWYYNFHNGYDNFGCPPTKIINFAQPYSTNACIVLNKEFFCRFQMQFIFGELLIDVVLASETCFKMPPHVSSSFMNFSFRS